MNSPHTGPHHATATGSHSSAPTQPSLATAATGQLTATHGDQWVATTFQVYNWGGFNGKAEFSFAPTASLISGPSGVGKSTILDAYIALMMPSDTPFNGASNDATTGRARSAEQRNLLGYLRGKVDTITDQHGNSTDKTLRGTNTATWGAVAMTFRNTRGHEFTAMRCYHVPARATRVSEITMRLATLPGHLDLDDLQPAAQHNLAPKALRSIHPDLALHDTYTSFSAKLFNVLGIGTAGDGLRALRLLVRIQSGHQIRTVDGLYKEMVLETPATFAAADRALAHFDALDDAHQAMLAEQAKADLLAGIDHTHRQLLEARAQLADLADTTPASDTMRLWAAQTEHHLRTTHAHHLDTLAVTARDHLAAARARELQTRDAVDTLTATRTDDASTERLAADIERLTAQAQAISVRRAAALTHLVDYLDRPVDPDSFDEEWADAQRTVRDFLASAADTAQQLARARDALLLASRTSEPAPAAPTAETRTTGLPDVYLHQRDDIAHALNIDRTQLPYIAELLTLDPAHEDWRTAIETVLAPTARTLLVPRDLLEEFSAQLETHRWPQRITFLAATPHDTERPQSPQHATPHPESVAAKLLIDTTSPYRHWLAEYLDEPARRYICVENPDQLALHPQAVTRSGQTRRTGRHASGQHGGTTTRHLIASAAPARENSTRANGERQRPATTPTSQTAASPREQLHALEQAQARHQRRTMAAHAIHSTHGPDLVLDDTAHTLARLIAHHDAITKGAAASPGSADLQVAKDEHLAAQRALFEAERSLSDLEKQHKNTTEPLPRLEATIAELAATTLTDSTRQRLDSELAAAAHPADPHDLAQLPSNLSRMHERVRNTVRSARAACERHESDLASTFRAYQRNWPDPDLGTSADSYPEYAAIHAAVTGSGLAERQADWRRRLTQWSGHDLIPLVSAYESAIETIEDRLEPVNTVLAGIPFGANNHRLRIVLRHLDHTHTRKFRTKLGTLAALDVSSLDDAATGQAFNQIAALLAQVRRRDDPRATAAAAERDQILDVRRHVEVSAHVVDEHGEVIATHSSLGGKSGGESQELVAFIVGAALRFRLGDQHRDLPRFAPVFLDEGFVKADAEFAGRAVQAWRGLGFQLIIGAPLDKVSALEPHVEKMIAITKNTRTHHAYTFPLTAEK